MQIGMVVHTQSFVSEQVSNKLPEIEGAADKLHYHRPAFSALTPLLPYSGPIHSVSLNKHSEMRKFCKFF